MTPKSPNSGFILVHQGGGWNTSRQSIFHNCLLCAQYWHVWRTLACIRHNQIRDSVLYSRVRLNGHPGTEKSSRRGRTTKEGPMEVARFEVSTEQWKMWPREVGSPENQGSYINRYEFALSRPWVAFMAKWMCWERSDSSSRERIRRSLKTRPQHSPNIQFSITLAAE